MAKVEFGKVGIQVAMRQLRPSKERFRHAVLVNWEKQEKSKLTETIEKLLGKWAGEKLWNMGYSGKPEQVEFMKRMYDWDTKIGIGISQVGKKSETIRQFCYTFVQLAENISDHYDEREAEYLMEYAKLKKRYWKLVYKTRKRNKGRKVKRG